ncbi:MAG: alpha/beta hydrolase family protein [Candidatus Hydrogenedentes bacterium]|nr:alpha/beta hydrolase family protein [Candidatus Hydrogenedentota bacterium]
MSHASVRLRRAIVLVALALASGVTSRAQETPEIPPYSVQPYMRARFDETGRALRFAGSTPNDVAVWRETARAKLREIIGIPTMKRAPLNPNVTESVDCGDYTRERVEIQTEPGIVMPVYVLIPKEGKKPFPVMIAPHGHGGGGKLAVAGVGDNPDVAKSIEEHHYAYGVDLCKAGFIVFCPDARGFGERQELAAKERGILQQSCQWLNNMAMPLGQTVTGMWVWDLMRLADYVETRDDCDAKRMGCAGLSGGGLQTLWFTALDDRVKAAVVSGYYYGVKESLLDMHNNCSCNYVPHLWENADHGDLGALIAPRPLMIQTGDEDSLNGAGGLDNVRPQIELAHRVYEILGSPEFPKHDVFHGPHRWDSTNAVPFLVKKVKK